VVPQPVPCARPSQNVTKNDNGTESSSVVELEAVGRTRARSSSGASRALPEEKERLTASILERVGDHGDEFTPAVVRSLAARLPPASLAKVGESLLVMRPRNRAAYAVGALKRELEELGKERTG
jgi:hypothetical protein